MHHARSPSSCAEVGTVGQHRVPACSTPRMMFKGGSAPRLRSSSSSNVRRTWRGRVGRNRIGHEIGRCTPSPCRASEIGRAQYSRRDSATRGRSPTVLLGIDGPPLHVSLSARPPARCRPRRLMAADRTPTQTSVRGLGRPAYRRSASAAGSAPSRTSGSQGSRHECPSGDGGAMANYGS
jgi:hypothetical protein